MHHLALLGLLGCHGGAPGREVPHPPPPPTLSVLGAAAPGSTVTIEVQGAAPGSPVMLVLGEQAGAGPCPAALGGACLGVAGGLRNLASGAADASGVWSVDISVPATAPIGTRRLQAALLGPPAALSPVATLDIASPCQDPQEPNDTPQEASAAPSTPWSSALCRADEDWFRFTLPASGTLQVDLSHNPALGDVDVELVDAAGLVRDGSYEVDGTEHIERHNASGAPEELWLHVWSVWASGPIAYRVEPEVTVRPACGEDPAEPDDGPTEARAWNGAPTGVVCEGDPDWFALPVQAGEWLRVDAGPAVGRVVSAFRDREGHLLGGGTGPAAEVVVVEDGELYLELTLQADDPLGQGEAYELSLQRDHATVCGPDALDPCGSPDEAAVITPGVWPDLRVCAGHDWYALDVAGGGSLEVWLRYDPMDGQIASQLFDPTGDMVAFAVLSGGLEVLYTAQTVPGRYLIHVTDFDDRLLPTAGGVSYAITVVEGP